MGRSWGKGGPLGISTLSIRSLVTAIGRLKKGPLLRGLPNTAK